MRCARYVGSLIRRDAFCKNSIRVVLLANVLLGASLYARPDLRDVLPVAYESLPLHVASYFGLMFVSYGLLVVGLFKPGVIPALRDRLSSIRPARLIGWFLVFALSAAMLQLGLVISRKTTADPTALLPFCGWVLLGALGMLWLVESKRGPAPTADRAPGADSHEQGVAVVLGGVFFLLSLTRDALLLWAYSYNTCDDSLGYLRHAREWLDFSQPYVPPHGGAPPYPLMMGITGALNDAVRVIWFQCALGALAVGLLVHVLSRRDRVLGILAGTLLLLDFNWAGFNRTALTEAPSMSFMLLSLAVLLSHFDRRGTVRPLELTLAGLLYAFMAMIRPSSLVLTILIVGFYVWSTRSFRKALWVALGIVAMIVLVGGANVVRGYRFGISYYGGDLITRALFRLDAFEADGGPASRRMAEALESCEVDPTEFEVIGALSAPGDWAVACMGEAGWTIDEIADASVRAYVEGAVAHPLRYTLNLLTENASFVSADSEPWVPYYYGQGSNRCPRPDDYGISHDWCVDVLNPRFTWDDLPLLVSAVRAMDFPAQPYMVVRLATHGQEVSLLPLAAWLIMSTFLVVTTHGRKRALAWAYTLVVLSNSLLVTSLYVIVPRYFQTLSPFHLLATALLLSVWVDEISRVTGLDAVWAALSGRRQAALSAAGVGLVITFVVLAALPSAIPTGQIIREEQQYWRGEYYRNANLEGRPAIVHQDAVITFEWGTEPPLEGFNQTDDYSVRWTRTEHFEAEPYVFSMRGDDGFRMYVDGELVIDNWVPGAHDWVAVERDMTPGKHEVVVEYFQQDGEAFVQAGHFPKAHLDE